MYQVKGCFPIRSALDSIKSIYKDGLPYFNPHVHMLVTMGGITKKGEWKSCGFLPFTMLRKQWQTVVLKLIRKNLNKKEKKQVQSRLQKAFSEMGMASMYMHQNRKKNQGSVMLHWPLYARTAIGANRIEAYDGQEVTFKYMDKKDGKEKHGTVTVEAFIIRLIRHIPDEQFMTIRHYGMYSRRSKKLVKNY